MAFFAMALMKGLPHWKLLSNGGVYPKEIEGPEQALLRSLQ